MDDTQETPNTTPLYTTPAEPATEHVTPLTDTAKYTLTSEAAAQLFVDAGVPRSPRSVERFCQAGHLNCIKVETGRNERYLITQESVEVRIHELQQIAALDSTATPHATATPLPTQDDVSRYNATERDMSRHDAKEDDTVAELTKLEKRVEELEHENRDLQITNRVKDQVLKQAEAELKQSRKQLNLFNRAVGELATILRLKAPDEQTTNDVSRIVGYLDAPEASEHDKIVDSESHEM